MRALIYTLGIPNSQADDSVQKHAHNVYFPQPAIPAGTCFFFFFYICTHPPPFPPSTEVCHLV